MLKAPIQQEEEEKVVSSTETKLGEPEQELEAAGQEAEDEEPGKEEESQSVKAEAVVEEVESAVVEEKVEEVVALTEEEDDVVSSPGNGYDCHFGTPNLVMPSLGSHYQPQISSSIPSGLGFQAQLPTLDTGKFVNASEMNFGGASSSAGSNFGSLNLMTPALTNFNLNMNMMPPLGTPFMTRSIASPSPAVAVITSPATLELNNFDRILEQEHADMVQEAQFVVAEHEQQMQ